MTIPAEELRRLQDLTEGLASLDDAILRFGPPDLDEPSGVSITTPAQGTQAPATTSYRCITYKGLSRTADVVIIDYSPGPLRATLHGKDIGQPSNAG